MNIKELKKHRWIIFGEAHFHSDEVLGIRKKIVELKPDIIIHELWWDDKKFYTQNIPGVKVLPLETLNMKKIKNLEIKDQFVLREKNMIDNLTKYYKLYHDKEVAIVIGDTHLRNTTGGYFYKKSPLVEFCKKHNILTVRSMHPELN